MRFGFYLALALSTLQCSLSAQDTQKEITNSIGMKLILIPRGEFVMGSPVHEPYRGDDEIVHRVDLSKEFYLGVTEVTQAQYQSVMGTNPSYFKGALITGESSLHPVEQVSWSDTVQFCKKLSELPSEKSAGRVYRLPTEAEWEYACRAGSKTIFSFGDDSKISGDYLFYRGNSNGHTYPVGMKKPNGWGLYDMYGNVCEWCSDSYDNYPRVAVTDPKNSSDGLLRVSRGGCVNDGIADCRSAARGRFAASFRSSGCGFRVALNATELLKPEERTAKLEKVSSLNENTSEKPLAAHNNNPVIRQWTSSDGKSRVRGRLLQFDDKEVRIVRSDSGKTVKALIQKLSQSDQDFLRSLQVAKAIEAPKEITNSIGIKLVLISKGSFLMGSSTNEPGSKNDERQHEVSISRNFYLGIYEVTQSQYKQVMGDNPSHFQGEKITALIPSNDRMMTVTDSSNHPVERVSWLNAIEFCKRLSALPSEEQARRIYRLPTEAEWEYSCRAGTTTAFSHGDSEEDLSDYEWYDDANGQTHPVGKKKPNAWGLYDMHGNVAEWCSDWYGEFPLEAVTDPIGPAIGTFRVSRGGSFFYNSNACRSAYRDKLAPHYSNSFTHGFRVVLDLSNQAE